MKIAIVQGAFYPVPTTRGGAIEKSWFALGREFASRGHDVIHYSRRCDGLAEAETNGSVRYIRVRGGDPSLSMLVLKWRDLLYTIRVAARLVKSDVIVTHTFWAPIILSILPFGPVWVHVQRYPKHQMALYRRAAQIQTVSSVIAKAISRQTPSSRDRLRIIANPSLPFSNPINPPIRDPNLVLFVGRIHPEKGIELLIQAAVIARRRNPAIHFVIVGPAEIKFGGGGPAFEHHLKNVLGVNDPAIRFVGPVFDESELSAYYESAGVFVYPSLASQGEASPVAPLEALAHGCPVVTSDLACFDDTVGIGPFAHRFDEKAPDATQNLADILVHLVTNRPSWEKASRAARVRAEEFSIGRIASEYLIGFATISSAI